MLDVLASDRLGQVIERAELHGFDRVVAARIGRQHDDRYCRQSRLTAHKAQVLQAVDSRQPKIDEHHVDRHCTLLRETIPCVARFDRLITEVAQGLRQAFAKRGVIVDDQDARHGNLSSNTAPCAASTARTVPPCAVAISRTSASPRPVPSGRPVAKGSNK